MNKQSIKKLLSYAEGELPLATLGLIDGIIEQYNEGGYVEAYDCLLDILFAMESFNELRKEYQKELNEPCLSDE
jgi:hypothetical protein